MSDEFQAMTSERAVRTAQRFREHLARVTRPLAFRRIGGPSWPIVGLGTGQVLQIGDTYFLVTAGHNLKLGATPADWRNGHKLEVGFTGPHSGPGTHLFRDGSIFWLEGRAGVPLVQADVGRKTGGNISIPLDLGIVEMTADEVQHIGIEPVLLAQVSTHALRAGELAMLSGFPKDPRFLSIRAQQREVELAPFPFLTCAVEPSSWAIGPNRHLYQVLRYQDDIQEIATDGSLILSRLPDANGLSGCAMWSILGPSEEKQDIWWVGVLFGYMPQKEAVYGCNMWLVVSYLWSHYPNLRGVIEAQFPDPAEPSVLFDW